MVIWPWPWIFTVTFWKCCISGMEGPIDMERKGCESIGCYTHFVTFNFQILKKLYLRNGMADWHGMKEIWVDRMVKFWKKTYLMNGMADWHWKKGMWVNRMLDPCCDFQCSPLPWPWPWIFKVKFWKSRISGKGWPIDMKRKGCESIEC